MVEWLRSAYASKWQFFRNSAVQTQGYYYFADASTQHSFVAHNHGSAVWTTDEGVGALGEQPAPARRHRAGSKGIPGRARRDYNKGKLPFSVPAGELLGDIVEISLGGFFPPAGPSRRLPLGLDGRLWTDRGLPVPPFPDSGTYSSSVLFDGAAQVVVGPVVLGSGSVKLDGAAGVNTFSPPIGGGSLKFDGTATHFP